MRPVLHPPRHPLSLVRFGLRAAAPATVLGRAAPHAAGAGALRRRRRARDLTAQPPDELLRGHGPDLRVPRLRLAGPQGRLGRDHRRPRRGTGRARRPNRDRGRRCAASPTSPRPTPSCSTSPRAPLPTSPGTACPARVARAYRRYRHGPAAFKVDLAVEGGIPWRNEACRRAGTVHVAGTFEEIVHGEREVNRGRMPDRPYVLLAQQYLADPEPLRGRRSSRLVLRARAQRL